MVWICRKHTTTPKPNLSVKAPKLGVNDPKLKLGTRTVVMYSLGEYANNGITSDSLMCVQSSDPALQGNNSSGPGGTMMLTNSSQKVWLAVNSLHNEGWLGYNGHPYFAGESGTGVPYITGGSTYDGIQDSAGSSAHNFINMAAGWNFQDGEQGFYVAIDGSLGGSVWIMGDLQNGIRGNGTASANNKKWVKVNLPAGDSAVQVYAGFTVLVLCDTVSSVGVVLGQRIFSWGVSGTRAADLGYSSASFGAFANSVSTYNVPTEIKVGGQHAHNIKCIAGGLDVNYLLFDSAIAGRADSTRVLFFGQYGWRGNHSSTVGADQVNTPADITARIYTQAHALNYPTDQIDTIVCDMASTHILYGSGGISRNLGWGSTEQGTLGNGAQLDFSTYSPPYDDGGGNESSGTLVQFTAVDITPGRTDWAIILNGGYYAYANQGKLRDGRWVGWGRNKPAYLPTGTKPIDGTAGTIAAVQPQGWQRPYVTIMPDAFSYSTIALSTSQGCFNACTSGPVTGSPCSLFPPTCFTDHAHLTATAGGTTVYLNASTSTSTGYIAYCTFFQTAGSAVNLGIQGNISTYTDTLYNLAPGTYTFKVVIIDQNWGADSTTATVTVSSQTGFYFSAGGLSTTCTGPSTANSCPASLFNGIYATETAGDTNYLNRGDAFPIQIVANVSGIAGNPIVTTWYGAGPEPLVAGRTILSSWTNISGNIWAATYTGPMPNILQHGDTCLSQTTTPDVAGGWFTASSMTVTTITDATHAGLVTIGTKIIIRSSAFTIDTAHVTNVTGSVVTFSPAAAFSGLGGNGWKIMNNTPYENGQWQDTLGQIRLFSIGAPVGNYRVPTVDTPLLSEGTNQTWDHIHFQGGNNADIILAFQANSGLLFSNDTITDGFDGIELRSEGGVTVTNTVIRHMSNNGVYKTNNNNYNNTFTNVSVFDVGMLPGMGKSGNNQGYSGILAGDSGCVIKYCSLINVGYIGIATYGSGFVVGGNTGTNFCYTLADGGFIYTWMPSAASFARGRLIDSNVAINGGGPLTFLGTTSSNLVSCVYLDNWTSQVTASYNSGYNIMGATFFDHGPSNTWTHNTSYGSPFADFYASEVGPVITGLDVESNVFGSATATVPAVRIGTVNNDLTTFGTINNNQIVGALGSSKPFWTFSTGGSDPGTFRSLPGWTSAVGYDAASTYQVGYEIFYYNQLGTSANFPFLGYITDLSGALHNGSVTIGTYSSQLFLLGSVPMKGIQGARAIVSP